MDRFELVVPAYNESKNLESVIGRAVHAATQAGLRPEKFTLIVVENGSQDDSKAVLEHIKKTSLGPWFRVVEVVKNQGYGNGLWQGLKTTQAEIIGWTHADQQCDPKDAIQAFQMLKDKKSKTLIKGVRFDRSKKDQFVSRVFEFMARLILGVKIHEVNAQPKVFRRDLLKALKNPPLTFAFDLYVLYHAIKAEYTINVIPVSFPPRIHGVSKWASTTLGRYKTILGMIKYMYQLSRVEGRL